MKPEDLEQNLNVIIKELCDGLKVLAEQVKCDATREELSGTISDMAERMCEHWPDCFSAQQKQGY